MVVENNDFNLSIAVQAVVVRGWRIVPISIVGLSKQNLDLSVCRRPYPLYPKSKSWVITKSLLNKQAWGILSSVTRIDNKATFRTQHFNHPGMQFLGYLIRYRVHSPKAL